MEALHNVTADELALKEGAFAIMASRVARILFAGCSFSSIRVRPFRFLPCALASSLSYVRLPWTPGGIGRGPSKPLKTSPQGGSYHVSPAWELPARLRLAKKQPGGGSGRRKAEMLPLRRVANLLGGGAWAWAQAQAHGVSRPGGETVVTVRVMLVRMVFVCAGGQAQAEA